MTTPDKKKTLQKVTLKTIGERLGLTPGTVSAALNNSAAARSIPEHTKQRILQAARELNYRPNFFARTLRLKRTFTIGVIASQVCEVCEELGIQIRPELTAQLQGTDSTPGIGYPAGKELLSRNRPFTALFAYNDISAIGSIWAFREAGFRVPEDISVVGFDDIPGAAFSNPTLSTVRQPLIRMGQIAAQTLVDQIEGKGDYLPEIAIEPEFVARASTGPVTLTKMKEESVETRIAL